MSYADILTETGTLLNTALTNGRINGLQVIPANFGGTIATNGFIRMNIIIGGSDVNGYDYSTRERGMLLFEIFTDQGSGELAAYTAADTLEDTFGGQTQGQSQFSKSRITRKGIDSQNPNLWRMELQVPFIRYN